MVMVAVLGLAAVGASAAYSGVWAADGDGVIHVLDHTDGTPVASFDPGLSHPIHAMTQIDDEVWVTGGRDGAITVLDLDGAVVGERRVESIDGRITGIAWTGQELWLGAQGRVTRHTLAGDRLGWAWQTAGDVAALAYTPGRVWTADTASPCLVGLASHPSSSPIGESRYVSDLPITGLTAVHQYVGSPADCDPPLPPVLQCLGLWAAHGSAEITWLPPGEASPVTLPNVMALDIIALANVNAVRDPTCPWWDTDLDDFVILKNNFGRTDVWGYPEGDYDGDGDVDLDDFALLKRCFNSQTVPEPSTAALMALAALALHRRRRAGL